MFGKFAFDNIDTDDIVVLLRLLRFAHFNRGGKIVNGPIIKSNNKPDGVY